MATQEEIHPWKWFVPLHSKVLFVGTFPPAKGRWSYDFFYPNKANLFWRILSRIAGRELQYFTGAEAVEERKQLLSLLNAAITDMGYRIIRKDNSSLDENIIAIQYMDILQILDEHPEINKIIFTSSSGPVSAARWFTQYLKTRGIIHKFRNGTKPLSSELEYKGRKIALAIVYSPSSRAANRISFDSMVAMYENEIVTS